MKTTRYRQYECGCTTWHSGDFVPTFGLKEIGICCANHRDVKKRAVELRDQPYETKTLEWDQNLLASKEVPEGWEIIPVGDKLPEEYVSRATVDSAWRARSGQSIGRVVQEVDCACFARRTSH